MKKLLVVMILLVNVMAVVAQTGESTESKWGWKIGVQTYTFKEFDFYQALEKTDSCGVKFIECHSNIKIGGGTEGKMDINMTAAQKNMVKAWLKKKGMKISNYGVVKFKTEEDWKKLFAFGKEMGIETFTVEPALNFIPLISSLCDKYKINVAIHNHADPSYYWQPERVLDAIKGYSKRIGACPDIGHWVRSGLDPVESLKKLEGHILGIHMKDLTEMGNKKAHDVVWGNGVCNISGVVEELKRQNFKGMITAEYEFNWFNNVPEVRESIKYLRTLLK